MLIVEVVVYGCPTLHCVAVVLVVEVINTVTVVLVVVVLSWGFPVVHCRSSLWCNRNGYWA